MSMQVERRVRNCWNNKSDSFHLASGKTVKTATTDQAEAHYN